jgi:hypothetical protein
VRPSATSACGLTLLVYAALRYYLAGRQKKAAHWGGRRASTGESTAAQQESKEVFFEGEKKNDSRDVGGLEEGQGEQRAVIGGVERVGDAVGGRGGGGQGETRKWRKGEGEREGEGGGGAASRGGYGVIERVQKVSKGLVVLGLVLVLQVERERCIQ